MRAVWCLTGIIKISPDEGERGASKAKLTLTLSITLHLTCDDDVDTVFFLAGARWICAEQDLYIEGFIAI